MTDHDPSSRAVEPGIPSDPAGSPAQETRTIPGSVVRVVNISDDGGVHS